MKRLVIKPTLACTARCPTCAGRRDLHRHARTARQLTFEEWVRLLADAQQLGVRELTISGGEPTLYPRLVDLVRAGRRYGWVVRVNTNGSLIDEALARRLLDAGLTFVDISLYGATPGVHDAMRGRRGSWQEATAAIALFARLGPHYPGFTVMSQAVLCRANFRQFADLLRLHHDLGSAGLLVSYLEGDFEGTQLLDQAEIRQFRSQVLPEVEVVVCGFDRLVRAPALSALRSIFSPTLLSDQEWAGGRYRPRRGDCSIVREQALVLGNGDVHPCNIVEYVGEPVVGNVFEDSLAGIWQGARWAASRRDLHPLCERCPMALHTYVPLRSGRLPTALARWILHGHLGAGRFSADRLKQLPMVRRLSRR